MENLQLSCVAKANECDSDLFSERKEREKNTFDTKSKQLPVLFVSSYVSYVNADLKSWSIGTIHARSHDDRLYQIMTENGNLISRNHVHLRPTSVQPVDKLVKPGYVNTKANKPIILSTSGEPSLIMVKLFQQENLVLLRMLPKPMTFLIEQGLVERSANLHITESNYICMHVTNHCIKLRKSK